jgi:predicted GIY-YIG superfamily endonuclease
MANTSDNYVVYILRSGNFSYIGMTNDFLRRWRQHNKIIKGGARYTSKREGWTPICIIDGFKTKVEAMQCEWKLKRVKGYNKRVQNVHTHFTKKDRWTSKSPLIKTQNLNIYIVKEYFTYFKDIPYRELYWF